MRLMERMVRMAHNLMSMLEHDPMQRKERVLALGVQMKDMTVNSKILSLLFQKLHSL